MPQFSRPFLDVLTGSGAVNGTLVVSNSPNNEVELVLLQQVFVPWQPGGEVSSQRGARGRRPQRSKYSRERLAGVRVATLEDSGYACAEDLRGFVIAHVT